MNATHAGCIVYRHTADDKEYLAITSKKIPGSWVLPKGHIEPGEKEPETALRELHEEANMTGIIEKDLGASLPYRQKGENIVVHYYLVLADKQSQPGNSSRNENRKFKWLSKNELLRTVGFPEILHILLRA